MALMRYGRVLAAFFVLQPLLAMTASPPADPPRAAGARAEVDLDRVEAELRGLETSGDPVRAYWAMWKLARIRGPSVPDERRLDWMHRTYRRLMQVPTNDYRWATHHRFNAVQMACELETAATVVGHYGEAFLALREAEMHANALWKGDPSPERMRGKARIAIGVTISLFLDRADHLERQGRIDEAEDAFRLAAQTSDLIDGPEAEVRRVLNNWAVFLSRIGRKVEADEINAKAMSLAAGPDDALAPEANRLRATADEEGATDAILEELRAHAERLRAAGKTSDALFVLRQCGTLCARLGRPDEAWSLFDRVEKEAARRKYREIAADCAYWRAKARSEAGLLEAAEADFVTALAWYRESGHKLLEAKVYRAYAIHLQRRGLLREAMEVIGEALRLNETMHLPYLRPDLLAVQAGLLAAMGRPGEAESVWREALAGMDGLARMAPRERLTLWMQRAEFLRDAGRREEMTALLAEAQKLADGAALPPYSRRHLDAFDPKPPEARPSVPIAKAAFAADIQPRYVATRVTPGGEARAWFWILNAGAARADGRLGAQGPGAISIEPAAAPCVVHARLDAGAATASVPLQVAPLSGLPVLTTASGAAGPPARIRLSWTGDAAVTSIWEVVADADADASRSTIHASLSLWNAFFSVPVYHEIGAADSGSAPLNFRIRSSRPCRLEIYDATRNRMIAVDSAGDGSFLGVGDMLGADSDGDAAPDVPPGTPVWARVFPLPGTPGGAPLDLTVEIRGDGGAWRVTGHDRIVDFGGPAASVAR